MVKWHFYRRKCLLLRKQHHQTTKPRSLLQKRKPQRYLALSDLNHGLNPLKIRKYFDDGKMSFLLSKKTPPLENNIIKRQIQYLFYRKVGSKDNFNFWPESCFKLPWVFFSCDEELRRPQADRSSAFDGNRKPHMKKSLAPRVSLTPLKICKFFNYIKVTF